MTSTLVLGQSPRGRTRYAESLLGAHPQVTLVSTHASEAEHSLVAGELPDHWSTLRSIDLTRALLGARNPVLVDDLPAWVGRLLDEHDLWQDPEAARATVGGLADELCLGLSALPFETVAISYEPVGDGSERGTLWAELVEEVNYRVSARSTFVHEVRAGRVLDLTDAPLAPEL
ncbi:hypothetical protein [Ornithinimicrobium panacihumi]|uniref:hypothetical protein n=1 Tax=Ornithinimicrobium panacihumi TaxID=2008449 RepID=UPI003F89C26F